MATSAPSDSSVPDFLAAIADDAKRADAVQLDALFQRVAGEPGVMWSKSIVGYGTKPVAYADGSERDWMAFGFSPRAKKFAIYGLLVADGADDLLRTLGKHSTAKECLYVTKLDTVDTDVLEQLARLALS